MIKDMWLDINPPEKKRTYMYADGTELSIAGVCRLRVSQSGTHYINTPDGKYIVPKGWRAIRLDIDSWTA
jgi:hypothetical protein